MTTMFPVEQVCAVCGGTSTHHVLGSTNIMGPSDLDMRPAPMARWTLAQQIQCCPHCGYCARDISEATEGADEVVGNEAYQAELTRDGVPGLTGWYLCASLLASLAGDDAHAGRLALMGAWAADDAAGETEGEGSPDSSMSPEESVAVEAARAAADRCGRLAIGYLEADRKRGLTFAPDEATADALLADLHRRVGDFESARTGALAGVAREPEGLVLDVLNFQLKLAESGDARCHNIGEIEAGDGFTIILPG